ncbi:sterol desaturase family [Thozetella sp. PMI_491]|nr:sterol desaturase family [Thozetella sp. PMI_491]
MDILLSLPIASYFFSSSLTSWSTSLNLLFFYMTWTTLVLSHSPLKIELIGSFALRLVFWLIPSLVFLLFDTLLPSLAESIKYNGRSALPSRDGRALGRLVLLAVINLLLETGAEAGISLGLATLLRHPVFKTTSTLPLPWQMIKHIGLLFTLREILTYAIHRYILHGASGRDWFGVSRLHKRYAHARAAPPFSLLVMGDHPLPFLLHRFVPRYLPALLLQRRLHLLTYLLFVGLCTLEETLSMSGYTVVPGIIMGGITRRTAVHYAKPAGNYGAWGLLDWMHGTSLGKDVMADVKDEAEKHRLKERSKESANGVTNAVQEGIEGLRRSKRSRGRSRQADSE